MVLGTRFQKYLCPISTSYNIVGYEPSTGLGASTKLKLVGLQIQTDFCCCFSKVAVFEPNSVLLNCLHLHKIITM